MTPDLMEAGAKALQAHRDKVQAEVTSGDRGASFGRLLQGTEPDFVHGVALYLDDITVTFDGFRALNALSLAVDVGELRCIIGPNGAGKTTMMDVITGKTRPDAGTASFGSNIDLLRLRENEIAQIGIGRKFQKPTVYEELSVFENLELALAADRRARASLFHRLSGEQLDRIGEVIEKAMGERAQSALVVETIWQLWRFLKGHPIARADTREWDNLPRYLAFTALRLAPAFGAFPPLGFGGQEPAVVGAAHRLLADHPLSQKIGKRLVGGEVAEIAHDLADHLPRSADHARHAPLPRVRDGRVEDAHRGLPDIDPGAVAFDVRDDGMGRHVQREVRVDGDLLAPGGHLDVLVHVADSV